MKYIFCVQTSFLNIYFVYRIVRFIYAVQNDTGGEDTNVLSYLNKLLQFNIVYDINENKFDFNGCILDISFFRPRSCHSELFVIPSWCIKSRTRVHR